MNEMHVATDADFIWLQTAALADVMVETDELYRRHLVTPESLPVLLSIEPKVELREAVSAAQVLLRTLIYGNAVLDAVPDLKAVADRIAAGAKPN